MLPWVCLSVLLLPTYLWKSLRSRPLALPHTPHLWLRLVDDTLSSRRQNTANNFYGTSKHKTHTNSLLCKNQTKMECFHSWTLRFHQAPTTNTLITTVYRKPTHTDQYLHWDSDHSIWAKHSVFNTLAHRAKGVSTNQQTQHKELEHIRKVLQAYPFPAWTLNKLQWKFDCKNNTSNGPGSGDNQPNNNNSSRTNSSNNNKNISIIVPYIQGLGERFKRTFNNKGIQVHFKGTNTIKTLLMAPKDRDNKFQKSGLIYKFKCPHINFPKEYIGESGRTFGERLKQQLGPHPPP